MVPHAPTAPATAAWAVRIRKLVYTSGNEASGRLDPGVRGRVGWFRDFRHLLPRLVVPLVPRSRRPADHRHGDPAPAPAPLLLADGYRGIAARVPDSLLSGAGGR